jgi:lysophospholipase L1-like esterase
MKLFFRSLLPILVAAYLCAQTPPQAQRWVATWGTAQAMILNAAPNARGYNNQTVRMIAHTSIGGSTLRVRLVNAFTAQPITLGSARVALRAKDSEIVAGSDRALTFTGRSSVVIGPGIEVFSDPVDLEFRALSDLAVSLYFPADTGPPTSHPTGLHTTYISKEGDTTAAAAMTDFTTTRSYYWLSGIDVLAPTSSGAVVVIGASTMDGTASTVDANRSFPALLAERLWNNRPTSNLSVVNVGLSGNRLLKDGTGVSTLGRLDRDVLNQPGVVWMIMMVGTNDVRRLATAPNDVTAEDVIWGYKQVIARAHARGVKVMGATLNPFEGDSAYSEQGEAARVIVNKWILTSGAFDAVVDFDAATRDQENPKRFFSLYDSGDHLHPNDAGYRTMTDAVDLSVFTK